MKTQYLTRWLPTTLTACLLFSAGAQAETTNPQEPAPSREELNRLIEGALPEVITEDNVGLVTAFTDAMKRQLEATTPLSKGFDPTVAGAKIFGDQKPRLSPDCLKLITTAGDLSRSDCSMFVGNEKGTGAFTHMKYSRNLGLGNIRYLQRASDKAFSLKNLKPVTIPDADAYKQAMAFLGNVFGLDADEIPTPPSDAKNLYPVKTVNMGWGKEARGNKSIALEKMVFLKRGFMFSYPLSGRTFQIAGPIGNGEARVIVGDAGVQQAMVANWQDAALHPGLESKRAKTRSQLVSEISEDLMANSQGPISSMKSRFVYELVQQQNNATGLLLPAVQVSVSPLNKDLSEEQQAQVVSSAGFIREYYLADLAEGNETGGAAPPE